MNPINNCNPEIANTVNVNNRTNIALDNYETEANRATIIDLRALIEDIVLKGLKTLRDLKAFKLML